MPVDPQRLEAAAAGEPEAMIELILAEGPDLRLFIAAHVNAIADVPALEQAIWSAIRRQLPRREVGVPVAEWLRWIASERIRRHLQTVDQGDVLIRLLVQECQAALADGRDQGAAGLATRLQQLSDETRDLLRRHYGEGEDLERISARTLSRGDAVAALLVAARSACDWRSAEQPMGDKLLPRLLEDWFAGVLDPASRALLNEAVARTAGPAAAIVRQMRLHAMLAVAHLPFGLRDATVLARLAAKLTEGRDQASSFRGRGMPRPPTGEPRRGSRVSSTPRMEAVPPASQSSLPMILVGAVVLIGVLVVVVMNRDVTRPVDPTARLTAVAPSSPAPPVNQPTAAGGSVLRPDFGGTPTGVVPGDKPLALAWIGDALQGSAYAGELLRLAVEVTRPELVAAVDFHAGDRLLATITKAPYTWEWREPTPFTGEISARAVAKGGAPLATITTALRILPVQGSGHILREWWTGSPGRTVAEGIKATSGFPARPKSAAFEAEFSAKRDWGESYFQRLRGFVIPPADGAYSFWVVGDDEAELWLSSDETSANQRRIAVCPSTKAAAAGYGKWEDRPGQRSEPVMLKAGRRYYIEALHKENGGLDHVEVGWQLPDGTMERPIPGKRLSPPEEIITAGLRGSRVFFTGFEDVAVGEPSPHFSLNLDPKVTAATAQVMDGDAAEGRRFLRINDTPGQQNEWTPEVCR
ncbi:MAG TPA: PA14 domain-containing protein, partial [Planctomycetota bacterium]|nr:PA14 domain-containing protein [Planctomycetota bacterium]